MNKLKDLIPAEDRHTAISLLVRARNALNPYAGEFICCNLSSATETWEEERIAGVIRAEIRNRLEGQSTVCNWLREVAGIPLEDVSSRWRMVDMVEYRKRWVDSMIAELA